MKKALLLICVATILASCGNTKPDQVSDNNDSRLVCTKTAKLGSNMPTKTCRTVAQQKEERRRNQEAMRNSQKNSSGSSSSAATISN